MANDCANPLLLEWIKEWLDQARERNSKGFTVYKKAYDSMRACPLKFSHPKEAQQLHGIGPKLCDRLTDKLKAHCTANGLPMPGLPVKGSKRKSDDEASETEKPAKKLRKTKPYVPALRSGAYALVLALASLDEGTSQGIAKTEVISLAQPHCDSSFTAPSDPTKFYTAWNSMKTLVDKDLVYEQGRPLRKYMLTDEGWQVAKRIKGTVIGSIVETLTRKDSDLGSARPNQSLGSQPNPSVRFPKPPASEDRIFEIIELPSSPESSPERVTRPHIPTSKVHVRHPTTAANIDVNRSTTTAASTGIFPMIPSFAPIKVPPHYYTIRLILDSREVRTTTDRDYISAQLTSSGLESLTRALPLGDALWIAEIKPEYANRLSGGCSEILLPHIVERKRLDDLISSIKDGRFHEQKFRLRKSGIANVVYIIENFSLSAERSDKYGEAVESAIASMQVVNGYFVKQTSKLDDTIKYLESMTRALEESYKDKSLTIIPTEALDSRTYLPMLEQLKNQEPDREYLIAFDAFAAMSAKSEALTLRDVFLKMLMCTRGVTGEKALEIQRVWPTPADFVDALARCLEGKERDGMVARELGGLIPRKKVAAGLSKKIAEVWGCEAQN